MFRVQTESSTSLWRPYLPPFHGAMWCLSPIHCIVFSPKSGVFSTRRMSGASLNIVVGMNTSVYPYCNKYANTSIRTILLLISHFHYDFSLIPHIFLSKIIFSLIVNKSINGKSVNYCACCIVDRRNIVCSLQHKKWPAP